MTVVELLTRARKRIERPECWTQGEFARDEYGDEVPSRDEDAVCWCMYGAVTAHVSIHSSQFTTASEFLHKAVGQILGEEPDDIAEDFNDTDGRLHSEVLAAFDRAIELATAEAGAS